GTIETPEFLDRVSLQFPKAPRMYLVLAWNSILLHFPELRLDFREHFDREDRYRLLLLSNTNELHMLHDSKQMDPERLHRFKNAFDVFYLSHEMGMRKTDREIFEFVLEQNQLKAEETFFVDDLAENTEAAASLGIQVWNLQLGLEDITELKSRLNP